MEAPLRLMCVLAHPDDESIALGGTLAKYAEQGVEISVVLATRGERGWFRDWSLYPGETGLGYIREGEVREACQVLGVSRLDFLDYIDGEVDKVNEAEITGKIVRLIREVRPDVVVTFGPDGLYGHPDHIAMSQFTTSAILCAADQSYVCAGGIEPHRVSKLYYRVSSKNWFEKYIPIFGDMIMQIDGQERRAHPWIPWTITTRFDTREYWQYTWNAVLCHETQMPVGARGFALSIEDHYQLWGPQEFYRVFSLVNGGRREETDLFEGIEAVKDEVIVVTSEMMVV